ncbi:type IV toxin-antitoxin system AbiEi family antitoxin domain-containing protein [Planktothrix sp. FACHB-1355]|uniref:Type IV toxin-antitoxin system AbiEi family antitoxin domain-containing protein n=1 Tax=Aerosakkonema funiforme FACHB-1375 TaxID=2949571 RepID=A0A926VE74_9CYAN|nr:MULTISPECIES: type IV toxin-antitoxin system AbiEi family antitoxin domain-containing protein [Oscillatoriales]MBD2182098.1 type IV toxin-antitoxin system AbiEi family antitoxin domain-containing protein [Aerosakkonema funiforme FACHB-1375]MBD3560177.1 type IV toxin-antitoxin system AbiEi family antitoxin domain-containing protein [Planktothrix sp. FACHB-1355]
MANSKAAQVLERLKNQGVIRSRDFHEQGIEREYLRRLEQRGLLMRSGRGIYTVTDAQLTENHSLAEASKRVPHATVCLLSALRFHELTTQAPFEVWLAIDNKARTPKEDILPLRIVYMSDPALSAGFEEHQIEGVPVRVYSPAKTVADCFKYRNKIGLDVAIEALRDCWKKRRSTADEIWHYAKICRVSNVMRPYLASLV